jgi:hypothetical protein
MWRAMLMSLFVVITGCSAIENGAKRDPRTCELDPQCARKPAKANDCATSCSDNADCMSRCHQTTERWR